MNLTQAIEYVRRNGNEYARAYARAYQDGHTDLSQLLYLRSNIASMRGKDAKEVKRVIDQVIGQERNK